MAMRFNPGTTRLRQFGFIAGDWGTTNLRLFLCDAKGNVMETKTGPGAAETQGAFAAVFDRLTSPWIERFGELPAVMCGMVGSRIGWRETEYMPSPVEPAQLATACIELRDGAIRIVPGLSCLNPLGAPDLMRGEETQVLGALQLDRTLQRGRHVLCLPGTHTKWVAIEEGRMISFLTAPAGELFDLLSKHSVLVHSDTRSEFDEATFERGIAEFNRHSGVQLLDLIFQCRSRWMMGDLQAESTASFLSGLLIACDVAGAMQAFAQQFTNEVHVIGSAKLTALYAKAFASSNIGVRMIDGEAAAVAGLFLIHQCFNQPHAN